MIWTHLTSRLHLEVVLVVRCPLKYRALGVELTAFALQNQTSTQPPP